MSGRRVGGGEGPGCPEEILEWIAWYPDGGLTDAQRGAVEAHAAACPACREELELLRCEEVGPTQISPEAEALFARVLARVERERAGGREAPGTRPPEPSPVPRAARPGRLGGLPRRAGTRAAALAASLLVGVLVGAGSVTLLTPPEAVYRTAAAPPVAAPAPPSARTLEVVFADGATAAEIRQALRSLGAEVVGGPTELGRFRLRLPPGREPAEAAGALRESGLAVFAEPGAPLR